MFPFDQYTARARIQPAFIVALPVGLLLFMFLVENPIAAMGFFGIFVVAGTAIAAQMGGEPGYNSQGKLWKDWGGPPTTRLLRHRKCPGDIAIASELRKSIEVWIGWSLPAKWQEELCPEWADRRYAEATAWLIEATRDSAKFPLVFAENINYGFRRNLWGLRWWGRCTSGLGAAISWFMVLSITWWRHWPEPWWHIFVEPDFGVVVRLAVATANTILLMFWLCRVRPGWVKSAADLYARRLMEPARFYGKICGQVRNS